MQEEYRRRFGKWLSLQRERRGMSQEGLAVAVEKDDSTVSRVENGKINVPVGQVQRYADALNVPDILPMIEAGYVRSLSAETANIAVEIEALSPRDREVIAATVAAMRARS